jgi:Transglutaminase-like superfamily
VLNETLNGGAGPSHREAPATAGRYWLARHVYLCVAHGHVVMLDLKRDKYLAVASPEELAPWVTGWPVASRPLGEASSATADRDRPADAAIPASLSRLARDGLLTPDPARGKTADPATIPRPLATLVCFQFGTRPRVKPTHAIALGRAWLKARIALSRMSMQRLVERVQERKARASQRYWDVQQARDIVTAFLWLRPLYYSPRGACLLDSLVLLELLAQREMFPTWVFGIKLAPFSAHCWIQNHDVVWNDTPEHAGGYTPIMCI